MQYIRTLITEQEYNSAFKMTRRMVQLERAAARVEYCAKVLTNTKLNKAVQNSVSRSVHFPKFEWFLFEIFLPIYCFQLKWVLKYSSSEDNNTNVVTNVDEDDSDLEDLYDWSYIWVQAAGSPVRVRLHHLCLSAASCFFEYRIMFFEYRIMIFECNFLLLLCFFPQWGFFESN